MGNCHDRLLHHQLLTLEASLLSDLNKPPRQSAFGQGGVQRASHLWAFKQEGIPDFEQDVAHDAVHKHHQEPVEGDERKVHLVLLKVGVEARQLLAHQVPEHTLIDLQEGEAQTQN